MLTDSFEIQDGRQGLIFDEKITILPVDHGDHKVGPNCFHIR
jgi:hypothetical protein